MGWSGGSEIMEVVIKSAMSAIPDEKARGKFYKEVTEEFFNADWGTVDEVCGIDKTFDGLFDKGCYGCDSDGGFECGHLTDEIEDCKVICKYKQRTYED